MVNIAALLKAILRDIIASQLQEAKEGNVDETI
jgi:hypothetical protein